MADRHRVRLLVIAAVLLAVMADRAAGVESLDLALGDLRGTGWWASDVEIRLAWNERDETVLQVSAKQAELPQPIGRTGRVELSCPRAHVTSVLVDCPAGRAHVETPYLERPDFPVAFRYERQTGKGSFSFSRLALAGGTAAGAADIAGTGWRARFDATNLQAGRVTTLLGDGAAGLAGWGAQGRLSIAARLAGDGAAVTELELDGRTQGFSFSAPAGAPAGENVAAEVRLRGQPAGRAWRLDGSVVMQAGDVLLVDPVVITPTRGALRLQAAMNWDPGGRLLEVTRLAFTHPQAVEVEGRLAISLAQGAQLRSAELRLTQGELPGLYQNYVQPLAVGTAFDSLDASGQVQGSVRYERDGASMLRVRLHDAQFTDQRGRFALQRVNGDLGWNSDGSPVRSHLGWASGALYRVPLGSGQADLEARGRSVRLLRPAEFQVLDGKLQVESFTLEEPATPRMRWSFDAVLSPLSMEAFSKAMGWPAMAGKLSGVIPAVTYDQERLAVGGVLLVRVFDGAITIRNLALERPFGVAPALATDITLENLDLDALTRTFAFGKIEGRLDGAIEGLQMVDWQPVAFDAWFATPPDDASRHRISQKAVDSLTSLGGGIGGALSRSYLRFFEDFSYDRIGLSCTLRDSVCVMDGLAPAKNGYYIVKGGGLPRINVIGYVRRVNWDELVERLQRVTQGNATVVK